jgi:heme O synthase-like polyprenyltransferase
MATESKIDLLKVAPIAQRTRASRFFAAIFEYWALTKPEVNFLILITTFAGFYLALGTEPHGFPVTLALHTLLGTLLMAGGTGTLNQFIERSFDAQMRRTARRPLALRAAQSISRLLVRNCIVGGGRRVPGFGCERPGVFTRCRHVA